MRRVMINVNENLQEEPPEEPPILILEAIISSTDNFVLEEPCSQRYNIFFGHFDFRPRRITKEEHMKFALEARDLMGKKEKEHVEGFQDVWAFDRLPYADLARNSSPKMDKISEDKDSTLMNYPLVN